MQRFRRILQPIGLAALDTVFPKTCSGCGLRGAWVCDQCEPLVRPQRLHGLLCDRCGACIDYPRCRCQDLHEIVSHTRAAFPYLGWVANGVRLAKYEDQPARLEVFSSALTHVLASLPPIDCIVPVPLHPRRLKQRGYNQSTIIAANLADRLHLPVFHPISRVRATQPQVGLNAVDRSRNVREAFEFIPDAPVPNSGHRVLLVDDVRTSCATVNACADAMTTLSLQSIVVATVAVEV